MSPQIVFEVDEETAEAIVEDIDDAVSSGEESWEFRGDFEIPEALQIRNELNEQLDR